MPNFSDGAPALTSSPVLEYSNSNPTIRRPAPNAKPVVVTVRRGGVDAEEAGDVGECASRHREGQKRYEQKRFPHLFFTAFLPSYGMWISG